MHMGMRNEFADGDETMAKKLRQSSCQQETLVQREDEMMTRTRWTHEITRGSTISSYHNYLTVPKSKCRLQTWN